MTVDASQQLKVYVLNTIWSGSWTYKPEIECLSATATVAPKVAEASFRLRYGKIKQPWTNTPTFETVSPADYSDYFCQVRIAGDPETVIFTGVIESYDNAVFANTSVESGDQVFTAYGLEHLLDRVQLRGALAKPDDTEDAVPKVIAWLPTFNLRRKRGQRLRGNRSETTTSGRYAFAAASPESSSPLWRHSDILNYIIFNYVDIAAVNWQIVGGDALDDLISVQDLEGLTVRQALNRLIPRAWGFGWYVTTGVGTDHSAASIVIFSMLDSTLTVGNTTIAANPDLVYWQIDDDVHDDKVRIRVSRAAQFDRIVVQGGRVVSCFTLSHADGTLEAGWTTAQEAAYLAATGSANTGEEALNDFARTRDAMSPVFARYRIPLDWDGLAGNGAGQGDSIAFPLVEPDGTLNTSDEMRGARLGHCFERLLPLMRGYDYTTNTPSFSGPTDEDPEFLPPMAFVKDVELGDGMYIEAARGDAVLTDDGLRRASAHVRPDDAELALWVRYGLPHTMAQNHWNTANTAVSRLDPDAGDWGTDWEDMIVTVACQTDTRVTAVVEKDDLAELGRIMVIEMPDAEMWIMLPGTVVGVAANGVLERSPQEYLILRDDTEVVKLVAALAARWFARDRTAAEIEAKDLTRYCAVGKLLWCQGQSALEPTFGIVTGVTWDGERNVVTTSTEFIEFDPVDFARGLGFCAGYESRTDQARAVSRHERDLGELRAALGNVDVRREPPVPFDRGPVFFDGARLYDATANTVTPNTWVATSNGPTPTTYTNDRRIDVHLSKPVNGVSSDELALAVSLSLTLGGGGDTPPYNFDATPTYFVKAIIEDFDPTDAGGTVAATGEGYTFDPDGIYYAETLRTLDWTLSEDNASLLSSPLVMPAFSSYAAVAANAKVYGFQVYSAGPILGASPAPTIVWSQELTVEQYGCVIRR